MGTKTTPQGAELRSLLRVVRAAKTTPRADVERLADRIGREPRARKRTPSTRAKSSPRR
jgi:hypothetical protein